MCGPQAESNHYGFGNPVMSRRALLALGSATALSLSLFSAEAFERQEFVYGVVSESAEGTLILEEGGHASEFVRTKVIANDDAAIIRDGRSATSDFGPGESVIAVGIWRQNAFHASMISAIMFQSLGILKTSTDSEFVTSSGSFRVTPYTLYRSFDGPIGYDELRSASRHGLCVSTIYREDLILGRVACIASFQ